MELKRVVVTGLGAITPVGNDVPEFWENLVNGVSGAGPITHFDASQFKTQFACEVKNFDVTKYIDRKEARKMDLYTQYAVAVAKEAVSDSGLDVEKEDLNRIGVIFGAGIGGIHTFEEEVSEVRWMDFADCVSAVRENRISHCIYMEELELLKNALHLH